MKTITLKLCFLAMVSTFISCTGTFYIVRHADRLNSTDTTPLSADGVVRASVLRDTLLSKGIDSIFVSNTTRSQQTAQPLATAIHEPMKIYSRDTILNFIPKLKKIRKSVLLVAHSEHIQEIIQRLCSQTVDPIGSNDFDNLYIVTIKRDWLGRTTETLIQTRYGRITP